MALNRAVEINHGRGLSGTPLARPQAQRSRKGFVHRLLGKIKITEQADQSCQDSSRIHAIKGVEQFAYLLGGTLGHDDDLSKPATPNQFGKRRIDAKERGPLVPCCLLHYFVCAPKSARAPERIHRAASAESIVLNNLR